MEGAERWIEDGLERGRDPEQVLLMQVRGGLHHAEPHPGQLLLRPGAVHMLADGADVNAGALGDGRQGVSSLGCLEPLPLLGR